MYSSTGTSIVRALRFTRSSKFSVMTKALRASLSHHALDVAEDSSVDRNTFLLRARLVEQSTQVQEAAKLGDRVMVVIDPQVNDYVVLVEIAGFGSHHEYGGGLPASAVAARPLPGHKIREQP